jgi:hypothetical protein
MVCRPGGRGDARGTRRIAILIAVAGSLIAAPAADATTTTIGSLRDPSTIGMGNTCSGCRNFQSATDPSSPSYVVPAGDWIVTSWSTAIGPTPSTGVQMLMLEHAGGTMYTLRIQDTKNATQVSSVNTFPVQIPVQPGWMLGLGSGNFGTPNYSSGRDADVTRQHPDTTVGNTTNDTAAFGQSLMNVMATLESDCDNDGLPDDTQDPELTDPRCFPPSPPPAPDTDPPETTITKAPANRGEKHKVKYKFVADEPSTFECKADKGDFEACGSPEKLKVDDGKHKFQVVAIDAAGNRDATPDKDKFKVVG